MASDGADLSPSATTTAAPRGLTFPDTAKDAEKPTRPLKGPGGPELKRELTQEDKGLAAAGYEELKKHDDKKEKLESADVVEHKLNFKDLADELKTSFDTKEPASSLGLTEAEVKIRLARDGRNELTPPKKKSALRVVCPLYPHIIFFASYVRFVVLRLPG